MIRAETVLSWHNRVPVPAIVPRLGSSPSSADVLVAAGDAASTRVVYAMVIGLALVGVVLTLLGVWLVRQTRADLEVLAPLERMGDGDWKKRDRSTQRRMLDEVRPDGAQPLTPSTRPPSLDAEFEQDEHPVTSFSDLGPGVASERRDPVTVEEPAVDTVEEDTVEEDTVDEDAADADVEPAPGPDDDVATDGDVSSDEVLSDPRP